jgi:DNA-binding GntR family transcriptional regulator
MSELEVAGGLMAPVVRVPDLRQQVYEGLREAIRRGDYPRDARFLEHGVARDFGVSRTPAREALALLVQDGLIVQDGRSFRFPTYTPEEIDQVFEVRRRIEPFAVRLAVERATDSELQAMRRMIETELAAHGKRETYVAANQRIRNAVFALCRNPRLQTAIHMHEDYIHFVRTHTLTDPAIRATSVGGMRRLAKAIAARDPGAAETAMDFLLSEAQIAIRKMGLGVPAEDRPIAARPKKSPVRRRKVPDEA